MNLDFDPSLSTPEADTQNTMPDMMSDNAQIFCRGDSQPADTPILEFGDQSLTPVLPLSVRVRRPPGYVRGRQRGKGVLGKEKEKPVGKKRPAKELDTAWKKKLLLKQPEKAAVKVVAKQVVTKVWTREFF